MKVGSPISGGITVQKVLIVDDNTLFRKILRESLHSRFPSATISEAKDREETLRIVESSAPDLIFMDIRLPDGNGLELTRLIKTKNREVKIIILTSYDEPEYREAASRCKADHYVAKDTFISLINLILADHLLN